MKKLTGQVSFENEDQMKQYLLENQNIHLVDGYGRAWMCKKDVFYFRDLGQIKFKEGFACGHLYSQAKLPLIFLNKKIKVSDSRIARIFDFDLTKPIEVSNDGKKWSNAEHLRFVCYDCVRDVFVFHDKTNLRYTCMNSIRNTAK